MIEKPGIFWVVPPCCWVISCRRFAETYRHIFQDYGLSQNRNTEEIGGSTFTTTESSRERNNPEDLLLHCETYLQLKKSFRFVLFPLGNASSYLDLRGTK